MHPNLKGQLATDAVFEPMKPFAEFQRMLERLLRFTGSRRDHEPDSP